MLVTRVRGLRVRPPAVPRMVVPLVFLGMLAAQLVLKCTVIPPSRRMKPAAMSSTSNSLGS